MMDEKRLIDANAVDYENIMCSQAQLHWLNHIVEKQPTVDAVVVVRCKDCKHWVREYEWQRHECSIFNGCYETSGYKTEPDDFCSYGERKANETK